MEDIRFAHYRVLDTKVDKLLANGGVTLAIGKVNDNLYRIAGAKCHEIDNYCKKNGRALANGRLFSNYPNSAVKKGYDGYYKVPYWVEVEHKPTLEDLLTAAEFFFNTRLPHKCVLVHSGVYYRAKKVKA